MFRIAAAAVVLSCFLALIKDHHGRNAIDWGGKHWELSSCVPACR